VKGVFKKRPGLAGLCWTQLRNGGEKNRGKKWDPISTIKKALAFSAK